MTPPEASPASVGEPREVRSASEKAPVPASARALAQSEPKRKAPSILKEVLQPGRGGQEHKSLQHFIKLLAEKHGFRASIEETILGGAGRVDVSLVRGERRIAFEISVTTTRDQELGNVEKCLAAGYTEIVLVGSNERHAKSLGKFIEESLEEGERGKVRYADPDSLAEYLDSLGAPPEPKEQTIRGIKVRTVQRVVDPKEASARRQAIAEVIARSLRKAKDAI